MNYNQAVDYIFAIPMFQNRGSEAYNPAIDKIVELCNSCGSPQNSFKSIHIAGTNGKGSTSSLLASVCIKAKMKTALYTSPHLVDFRERIKVDDKMISEEFIAQYITQYKEVFEIQKPSFFELTTLLAFAWFAHCKVDIAIIECGLGGRLDATNIISPLLSIITNVSFDHVNILGNSLKEIAYEKSGIIKPNTPLVIGSNSSDYLDVILEKAKEVETEAIVVPDKYKILSREIIDGIQHFEIIENGEKFKLSTNLLGIYQKENILTAYSALRVMIDKYGLPITTTNIIDGFCSTTLMGRWQVLEKEPLMICDTGHNEAGIKSVVEQLKSMSYNKLFMVIGVVADKDLDKILPLLPKDAEYIFTKPSIFRALDETVLYSKAVQHNLKGCTASRVKEAVEVAKSKATSDDLIFIGGSTFTVAAYFESKI